MGFFGPGEWLMVVAISAQATAVAYLGSPRVKAALVSLPIPFTTATIAFGAPVGVHTLLALLLLHAFALTVWALAGRRGWPIVAAIAVSIAEYVLVGWALTQVVPDNEVLFWITFVAIMVLAWWLLQSMPPRAETAWRSPLPVYLKVPILAGIIALMVALRDLLGSFISLFPIMSSIGAYEARFSLWTMTRQFPITILTIAPMLAAYRLAARWLTLGPTLAVGWVFFALAFVVVTRHDWTKHRALHAAA